MVCILIRLFSVYCAIGATVLTALAVIICFLCLSGAISFIAVRTIFCI